jgi:hypothetical protein
MVSARVRAIATRSLPGVAPAGFTHKQWNRETVEGRDRRPDASLLPDVVAE